MQFKGNEVVERNDPETRSIIFHLKGKYILFADITEVCEPFTYNGITIMFAGPDRMRFKEFIKFGRKIIQYMDPWSEEEIFIVKNKLYPNLTDNQVGSVYYKFGGVIRYVLAQNELANSIMDEAVDKALADQTLIYSNYRNADDDSIKYKLLHYICDDKSKKSAKLKFASDYVAAIFLKNLKN